MARPINDPDNTTITAPDGTELLPAAAADVMDTTPYNLDIATLAGFKAISAYERVIVVDPNGRGDYATLAAALAAASTDDSIYVFGLHQPSTKITVDVDVRIYITPGAQLSMGASFVTLLELAAGTDVWIWNRGLIVGLFAPAISLLGDAQLHLHGGYLGSAGDNGIEVASASAMLNVYDVRRFPGSTNWLSVPGALAAGSAFQNCYLQGSTLAAVSAAAWSDAPFYHCTFDGGLSNITFAAGNNSNVTV